MSTTPKHTPGPWEACRYPLVTGTANAAFKIVSRPTELATYADAVIARISLRHIGTAETKARNAHLIAAAPSLLAACKMVDAAFNAEVDKLDAWDAVTAAIAEAEGEGWLPNSSPSTE